MNSIRHHIFGLLVLVLITVLSLMPVPELPQMDIEFSDKWAHWAMYGFLTMVLGLEHILADVVSRRTWKRSACRALPVRHILAIAMFASSYGGLMELAQAYLTTCRSGDWLDALANAFGTLCGSVCLLVLNAVIGRGRA